VNDRDISRVVQILSNHLKAWELPIVTDLAEKKRGPYMILVSTLLSLRTKDEVTAEASARLFALASTPDAMIRIPEKEIARVIYPVGFYKTKAKTILQVSRDIIDRFAGRVPDSIDALLTLKGVGRKTANLVVALGYGKDGICVDTHVHRISNRLGYVKTKNPQATEFALRDKLPKKYWQVYNTLMVAFGRNICRPLSPLCSVCPVFSFCDRAGVTRSR